MGEHLPCKQGVKSSNLSVSIVDVIKLLQSTLYLENCIQREIIKPFIILTRHLKISKRKI